MSMRVLAILLVMGFGAELACSAVATAQTQSTTSGAATSSPNPAGDSATGASPTAQRVTNPPPNEGAGIQPRPESGGEAPRAYITYKTPYEFWLTGLTIALLVFMAGLLTFMAWMRNISSEFLKAYIILTVVFAALFLIVAGYTDKQTAPVFSLLGTIIGYLFGRATGADGKAAEVEKKQTPPSPSSGQAPSGSLPPPT